MTRDSKKDGSLGKILFSLLLFVSLSACASGYNARAASAHRAYFAGDYERALELIDEVKPARRDRLLYLLDKGMILHAAGRYRESNLVLTEAEDLADALYTKSISREAAATLWSEEAVDYRGDKYERALIPVIRMLNYIMLDEWNEALVEVRRLNNSVERIYGPGHEFGNDFSTYLSAITWEAMGQINDALIDYKRLAKQGANVPYYGYDIEATSRRLGMASRLPPKSSIAWRTSPGYRKGSGELVVIAATGEAPKFVSEWVSTGYFTVSMPRVVYRPPRVSRADVIVDGKRLGSTYPFFNIIDQMEEALKERAKRSLIRKMVKLTVQTGLYSAGAILMESDETEEQIAGIALSLLAISMAGTDKADERSWRTLPASFQIGRFYLTPGRHSVKIVPEGGGKAIEKEIELGGGRPSVVVARFGDTSNVTSSRRTPTAQKAQKTREAEMLAGVRRNPSNGSLKLDLAEAKIEGGSYAVDSLVRNGLDQGGSREKAALLMVAALTLSERYPTAIEWSEKGSKSGPAGRYSYYAQAIGYASGSRPSPPEAKGPALSKAKGFTNAFDHYVAGLVAEKSGDYDDAAELFAQSYEQGLMGESVIARIVQSFRRADESFKESERGVDIISQFAESFVEGT